MTFLAVVGFLISAYCFLSGLGLKTESAIHQIYVQSLMVNSALGLLILTVAVAASVVVNAIRNAQADNRKLLEGLRTVVPQVDPPAVVPNSTQVAPPQNGALA